MKNAAIPTPQSSDCGCCAFLLEPEPPLIPSTIRSSILETNDPPAEVDIPAIREFVARGSARRTRLDAKIVALKASLDELLQDRNPLDTEIRKHEGAVSPLRRMPTELLSLIFKYTLPTRCERIDSAPWAIAAVCSRWRTIVLAQPSLWSTVVLDFTSDPDPVVETEERLQAHLERSGQSPLDITFITWDDHYAKREELEMLDILADHCERWETVTMLGPPEIYYRLDDIRECLPVLRQLHITVHPLPDEQIGTIDIFEFCPRLQEAFINEGPYEDSISPITVVLPFSQLLRFSGTNAWIDHLSTLRSASNLVDCVLSCIRPVPLPSGMMVTLPRLLRLSVSTTKVLDSLDTPVLQELYCCNQTSQLHAFLRRLRGRLQKLVVPDTPSAADVVHLLHAAPTITTLGIYLPVKFTPELFAILGQPSTSEPAKIPALESISIRVLRETVVFEDEPEEPHLDQDLFMQMLEAQWQHGTWRSVRFFFPQFAPSPDTLQRMELLRSQGMQIIVYPRSYRLYTDLVPPDFRLFSDFSVLFI